MAFFYALWMASAALRGGEWFSACLVQAFVLHVLFVAFAVAAALLFSFVATPSAGTTILSIFLPAMFFFGRRLPEYAENASGVLGLLVRAFYWVAPHVEFFDMRQRLVHGWGGVGPGVFLAVIGYGLAYTAVALWLAHIAFKRKKL